MSKKNQKKLYDKIQTDLVTLADQFPVTDEVVNNYHYIKNEKKLHMAIEANIKNIHDKFPNMRNKLKAYEEDIIEYLMGWKDSDHWSFLEQEITKDLQDKNYYSAFIGIYIALDHLKQKSLMMLSNGEHAFSNKAFIFDTVGSYLPGAGTFFKQYSLNQHENGLNKTEERLQQIDEWLAQIKEYSKSISTTHEVAHASVPKPR